MIALVFDPNKQRADITRVAGLNIDTDEGLESYVTSVLFTDARADESDDLDEEADKRGWWGSQYLDREGEHGSKLWLLRRQNLTANNLILAGQYARDAFLHLVTMKVAKSVEANCVRMPNTKNVGVITLKIERPKKTAPRFERLWEVQFGLV